MIISINLGYNKRYDYKKAWEMLLKDEQRFKADFGSSILVINGYGYQNIKTGNY